MEYFCNMNNINSTDKKIVGEDRMEYQFEKENCFVCEKVFEGSSEQAVDLDFSLPDYCPDIERILKCRICPSVMSKNISSDRLDVDGVAVIKLYYLDTKKQAIRLCEHTSPFSCSFNIKSTVQDPTAIVKVKTEYLNCRALTPRKLDIHGAFSVCAAVYQKAEQEYCCSINGDDIQQRKHTEQISCLSGIGQQQFSISEVLDIGQGKGSPESILRSEFSIGLESAKALSDKIMLKGEAVLRLLYVTDIETGLQDTMTFNIPYSQVIDAQGISDISQNDIKLEVMNYDVSLKSEYDESSTLVTLDAKICATVFAYDERSIDTVDDAYSTVYELDLEEKNCKYSHIISMPDSDISVKEEVKTGDNNISKIIDTWCDGVSYISNFDGNTLTTKGKVNCCIFAVDKDGVPFYIERPLEFSVNPDIPQSFGEISANIDLSCKSLSFRITGDNSIELKADLKLKGIVFENKVCRAVTGAVGNEDQKRVKDKNAALTLYYADEGENLWSIARLYCTSVEAIKLENELTDDIIQAHSMILIPM